MRDSWLFKFFSIPLVVGLLTLPLSGCGVESEPVGVDNDPEMEALEMEDPEYIEGEEAIDDEY